MNSAPMHGTVSSHEHLLVSRCMWLELCSCLPASGVFSMDGHIAPLPDICALARQYGALVFVVRACSPPRKVDVTQVIDRQPWLHKICSVGIKGAHHAMANRTACPPCLSVVRLCIVLRYRLYEVLQDHDAQQLLSAQSCCSAALPSALAERCRGFHNETGLLCKPRPASGALRGHFWSVFAGRVPCDRLHGQERTRHR